MNPDRKYLHLHDGNGHVIHRHKPDLTLGDFFHSLGMTMTSSCFELDDFQFQHLDQDGSMILRERRTCAATESSDGR